MTRLAGIDVSRWQTRTPDLSGLSFAFARATYGVTADARYAAHTAAFRAAGLVVGAYHFGVGGAQAPIPAQVEAFLRVAGDADLLALDLERNGSGPTMTQAEARTFIASVHGRGRRIGLYASRSGFPARLGQDWDWIADYTALAARLGRPATTVPWTFWQWTSRGGPGGSGLDRDWFNGDLTALRQLAGKEPERPAPVSPGTIADLRRYIAKLAAVKRPTAAVRSKLAEYRSRLVDYLRRVR